MSQTEQTLAPVVVAQPAVAPTALLIRNEWNALMKEVSMYRDGFDDEPVDRCITEGFWSVVYTFDGDIIYKNMSKNFETQLLFGVITQAEYLEIIENTQ